VDIHTSNLLFIALCVGTYYVWKLLWFYNILFINVVYATSKKNLRYYKAPIIIIMPQADSGCEIYCCTRESQSGWKGGGKDRQVSRLDDGTKESVESKNKCDSDSIRYSWDSTQRTGEKHEQRQVLTCFRRLNTYGSLQQHTYSDGY